MNRREILLSAAAASVALIEPARAWQPVFDTASASIEGGQDGRIPLLSTRSLEASRQAADLYANFATSGGWPAYPWVFRLSLGVQHEQVQWLRQRLAVTGDLAAVHAQGQIFDSLVDAGLRRFQARHGLSADGVAGTTTFEALNRTAAEKAQSLSANLPGLERAIATERRYVTVNVPSADIEMVEDDAVVLRQSAVVGQPNRATPLLSSAIHEINFNPYWHVPASIIRKDLIPIIRDDRAYLDRMGMRIFDGSWNEIPPDSIDWSADEATRYIFRQEPGSQNALGRVRINFANDHAVYLHDTPQPGLFGDSSRFHSSGCVRVQRIPEFVSWLLKETPGWPTGTVAEFLRNGERKDVSIANPVPVHFVYVTAWGVPGRPAQFRPDIYDLMENV